MAKTVDLKVARWAWWQTASARYIRGRRESADCAPRITQSPWHLLPATDADHSACGRPVMVLRLDFRILVPMAQGKVCQTCQRIWKRSRKGSD